ncbi:uncharacterized protein LOC122637105 isoform X1 [Vespula pensylvanica]|uniref:uncharacterized protein LOC122637105 isoform X1 n=1 Tax=Vespula pensylvanica TaxID=30213 RepID=UPI001CBA5C39|nr:uncharacterized protein LOC122637105 isoform X1 [Vespula pensylvanica]
MFREGQYIEVIKLWVCFQASDNCVATVVVTVQEQIIEIKKKKISTNKWLDLEDWAAVYKILERVVLRNCKNNINEQCRRKFEGCQWKKSTRQLEITCTIESFEWTKDTSLLTIRVNVSPARRKLTKNDIHEQSSGDEKPASKELLDSLIKKEKDLEKPENHSSSQIEQSNYSSHQVLEEYVPDAPIKKNSSPLKYIPSRKSTLQSMQMPSNEYTPVQTCNDGLDNVPYVPNSIKKLNTSYEAYEPHSITSMELVEEYVPNSKGIKTLVEEYEPNFRGKLMKFDESYVPSTVQISNEDVKRVQKIEKLKSRRKGTLTNKKKTEFV